MQISSTTVGGPAGSATRDLDSLAPTLNAIYGPRGSGKTTVFELIAHALYGRAPRSMQPGTRAFAPSGAVEIADRRGRRLRLRRYQDQHESMRLSVAALDGSAVDAATMGALVGGLSPHVLAPLCAVSFREPPDISQLLSIDFIRDARFTGESNASRGGRRLAELTARRDQLAQELESRLHGERQASGELQDRWRDLDRLIRTEQQQAANLEQRLRAVDTSLAETDARLRYRRLELNIELRWQTAAGTSQESAPDELDGPISQVRATIADLAQREANVRAKLAELNASPHDLSESLVDETAWLAVARQLAADLTGEVARLARASASQECVCRDAHPRLRPIVETLERQLTSLDELIGGQRRATTAVRLEREIAGLARCQDELRRHLECLLDGRQSLLARRTKPTREAGRKSSDAFSAADVEQLESRRLELERERLELLEQLREHARNLRDLRATRETVERQRAALLSARSIEHVQRELASIQKKIEQSAADDASFAETNSAEIAPHASDYLAALTDGNLVRLVVNDGVRQPHVVNRQGEMLPVESLSDSQHDLVYVAVCLAMLSAASRHGIWLPLLLDEPFARLDARGTAALAAVLDDFCRRGHQVLVFTDEQSGVERLASLGAAVHDLLESRETATEQTVAGTVTYRPHDGETHTLAPKIRRVKRGKVPKTRSPQPKSADPDDTAPDAGRSDAA